MIKKKSGSGGWQGSWIRATFTLIVLIVQVTILRQTNNFSIDLETNWIPEAKTRLETWTNQKKLDLEVWATNKIQNIIKEKLDALDLTEFPSIFKKSSANIWISKVEKIVDDKLDKRLHHSVVSKDNIRDQGVKILETAVYEKLDKDFENKVIEILKQNVQCVDCNQRRVKRSSSAAEDNNVEPDVEFFNPKVGGELKAKGEPAPGGDSWVWLTSYSRIPYQVVQGFCKATQEYCPPGAQGPPGQAGPRGPRGERGAPGERGGPGPIGPPGPKGETGFPGHSGLDGRDGVPGEPGLDGVPGRSGADGAPGMNGRDGNNGSNGINGTDGKPGGPGPPGPAGPIGPRGLSGPRGRAGRAGTDGAPGLPGISAWMHNSTQTLLIAPSIAVGGEAVVVHEGEPLRLACGAKGTPTPEVQWARVGDALRQGVWRVSSLAASALEVPRVSRHDSGRYTCTAHNGVPPQATKEYILEVHFPPMIRIRNQMIAARNGGSIELVCEVEAFPEPLRYWERADGRLLEPADRFRSEVIPSGAAFHSVMKLRLSRVHASDVGQYNCIAKNELGLTKGVFTVFEQDPLLGTPPPLDTSVVGEGGAEYGQRAPPSATLEELCPPAAQCPTCPRCSDPALSLADLLDHLRVEPLAGKVYMGLPPRVTDCQLYAIGKPVYHRYSDQTFGSWMRDAATSDHSGEKIWVTRESDVNHLFEFFNKTSYRKDQPDKSYKLDYNYVGNGHIVHNGSFYYHAGGRKLARMDIGGRGKGGGGGGPTQATELPGAAEPPSRALYSTAHTYMDFSADDNGLWVIYAIDNSNNTAVAKIDLENLHFQYIWNISVNHHKVGEMFVVCGVLYAVDSATERTTRVRLALDLYTNKLVEVALPFTNPFKKTTVLSYNHRNKELYSWDKGNQLTYPVRYHDLGYNTSLTADSSQSGQQMSPPDE